MGKKQNKNEIKEKEIRGEKKEEKREKREEKKDEDYSKKHNDKDRRKEKQTILVFVGIFLLFSAFLIPYFYFKSQRIFEYEDLLWQVDKDGDVTFYHTQINKTYNGVFYGLHNIYFRNDPRKNRVPIDVEDYSFFREIIITSSPEVLRCEKQILVTDALAQITLAMPLYNKEVRTAISDEYEANATNQRYVTCESGVERTTIIQVELGGESRITHDVDNKCYKITIKDCSENLLAAEKFIIEVVKRLI